MAHWIPRIRLPSDVGTYERILNSESDVTQLRSLHGKNVHTVLVAIVAWASLLGDSPSDCKPHKVINAFVNDLVDDYKGTCNRYSELADAISREVYHDHETQTLLTQGFIDGFKATPVFREYMTFHRERDPQVLRFLLSFLNFGRKIGYEDTDLDAESLRLWHKVEERLKSLRLPSFVSSLRKIVHWMFERGWETGPFLPKHGSGSVAERRVWGAQGKNEHIALDPKVSYLYDVLGDDEVCRSTPNGIALPIKDVTSSAALLKFVPKDMNKTRAIAMEPIDFMWAQQGVRLWYERWLIEGVLGRHVFLNDQTRNQIMCWHGSISSDLATIDLSSASDCVALILIKAIFPARILKHLLGTRSRFMIVPSDEEPRRVEKFAPMGSALCFPVQCTIFSAVALMVSIAMSYGRNLWEGETIEDLDIGNAYFVTYGQHEHRHYTPFFVYGDDMILDKRIVSNTIRTLELLGFQVNEEKSYVDEVAYRESCGIHCFNGFDVTPLQLKVKPLSQRMSLEAAIGLVDAANRAGECSYLNLRSSLINVCLRYPIEGVAQVGRGINPILFVPEDSEESFALVTTKPRNDHLPTRSGLPRGWVGDCVDRCASEGADLLRRSLRGSPKTEKYFGPWQPIRTNVDASIDYTRRPISSRYQREETGSIGIGPAVHRKGSQDYDPYYYTLWWRARYGRNEFADKSSAPTKVDTKEVRAKWRWTAAW